MKYNLPKTKNDTVNSILKVMYESSLFTTLAIDNLVKYIITLEKGDKDVVDSRFL